VSSAPREAEEEEEGWSVARVLAVDDNPEMRMLLTATVQRAGYEVVEATDGDNIMHWALDTSPDAILLDILMPNVDGWESLRMLKADERTRDIPVIVVSALNQRDDIARARRLGAFDYVPKPWHPGQLESRIRWAIVARDEDNAKERT